MSSVYFVFLLYSQTVFSQTTRTWVPTTGGVWTTAANWSPVGAPVTGDDVIINSDQSAPVTGHPAISLRSLTINGNCTITSDAINTSRTITVSSTLTIIAGKTLYLGSTTIDYRTNLTLSSGATGTVNGTLYLYTPAAANTITIGGNLTIGSSGLITGVNSSAFTLNSNATLQIANAAGITVSGATGAIQTNTRNYLTGANYIYNGTSSQVTGTGLTQNTPRNLTINNSAGVSLSAATTISRLLTMTSGTLNMANNNLTVGDLTGSSDITNSSGTAGDRTITVGSANTNPAVYTGIISNGTATSVALTKNGTGTLAISGANTYTGLTTVSSGVLNIRNSNALGDVSNGTVVLTGAALQLQGGISVGSESLTISGTGISSTGALRNISGNNSWGGNITLGDAANIRSSAGNLVIDVASGNAVSGTFNLTFNCAGSILVADPIAISSGTLTKSGTATLTLSGTNTYTGTTTVSAGVLNIQNNSALGDISNGTVIATGAALQLQGGITVGSEALTISGTGPSSAGALRNISGINTWGGNITLGDASIIGSSAGNLVIDVASGNAVSGAFNLTFNGAGNILVADPIATSTGTLTKSGSGILTLSGTNTYTGTTTVSAGVLNIQNNSALGEVTNGTVLASNGAVLQLQGGISVGSEPLSVRGTGISTTGAIRNISGNNTWGGLVTLIANTTVGSDAGTLIFDVASGSAVTGTFNLTFTGAGNILVADPIATSTGTLSKSGTGMLTLSGANTYTGATAVSAGVLNIQNNSALGDVSSGTSISSGAALQLQGGINTGSEALSVRGTGITATGAIRNISGNNTWGGLVTQAAATTIGSDAGTLIFDVASGNAITGTQNLTITGAGNINIADPVAISTGTLTKTGSGTLLLSAANHRHE